MHEGGTEGSHRGASGVSMRGAWEGGEGGTDIEEDLVLAVLDALASPRNGVRQRYRGAGCSLQSVSLL